MRTKKEIIERIKINIDCCENQLTPVGINRDCGVAAYQLIWALGFDGKTMTENIELFKQKYMSKK